MRISSTMQASITSECYLSAGSATIPRRRGSFHSRVDSQSEMIKIKSTRRDVQEDVGDARRFVERHHVALRTRIRVHDETR